MPRGAEGRPAAAHGVQRRADQHPGELLSEAPLPGRRRAPQAGGQDAALRGAGERGAGSRGGRWGGRWLMV